MTLFSSKHLDVNRCGGIGGDEGVGPGLRGGNGAPGRTRAAGKGSKARPRRLFSALSFPARLPSFGPSDICPSFLCAFLLLSGVLFSLYLSPSSRLSLPFLFPSYFGLSLISFILPFFLPFFFFLSFCVLIFFPPYLFQEPVLPPTLAGLLAVPGLKDGYSHGGCVG